MDIASLEKLLDGPRDGALLRLSLARLYLQQDQPENAVSHLRAAVAHTPAYTAAWKELGRALALDGQSGAAVEAYRQGIEVAASHGDVQAQKEMQVFLKRLLRQQADAEDPAG
jgi:Tfp pilus assembly protein PilF